MGNRAVITTHPLNPKSLGLYLHWNGGRASVEGFLGACKELGYRAPDSDCYGMARLAAAACAFFPDGLSVGIDTVDRLDTDNHDNGTYLIKGWEIVGREHVRGSEEIDAQKTADIQATVVKRLRLLEEAPNIPTVTIEVTPEELALIVEALDSHEYWQLRGPEDRNDGYSQIEDEDAGEDLKLCRELYRRLEPMTVA